MTERLRNAAPRAELIALLHAARQQPDDDAPRLIVADWLEEHGDEIDLARAEFLRLQVRSDLSPAATHNRAGTLLTRHRAAWLGPFADLADQVEFERGMLVLHARVPHLLGRDGANLVRDEAIFWLEKLELHDANDAAVNRLISSPILPHVGNLVISNAGLSIKAGRALRRCSETSGLVALDLNNNRLSNLGARALADSPNLSSLLSLALWQNQLGPSGAVALAETPYLHHLRHLNLGGNSIQAEGIEALADSPILANVETLFVWDNGLGDGGTRKLAQAPAVKKLRTLYLNANGIGDRGLISLLQSPHLTSLERLDLHKNRITDKSARILLESPLLPQLREVFLVENALSPSLLEAMERRFPWITGES